MITPVVVVSERVSARSARVVGGEQLRARAEHDRVDLQRVVLDQPRRVQRVDQLAAAQDREAVGPARLERRDRLDGLTDEHLGVRVRHRGPGRAGDDELLRAREHVGERVGLVERRPEAEQVLVRATTEQQRATLAHALGGEAHRDLVLVAVGPAAVGEAAAGVLVAAARALHDAVEGDVLKDGDAHALYTNGPGPDRHRPAVNPGSAATHLDVARVRAHLALVGRELTAIARRVIR